jgi:hypothetical protein
MADGNLANFPRENDPPESPFDLLLVEEVSDVFDKRLSVVPRRRQVGLAVSWQNQREDTVAGVDYGARLWKI